MKKRLCIFTALLLICVNISGHAVSKHSLPVPPKAAVVFASLASVKEGRYVSQHNSQNSIADKSQLPPVNEQKPPINVEPSPKKVFLTFDDGPSGNTPKILNILNANAAKASFFVLGSCAEKYPDIVKSEYNNGMAVLNHSYSHSYSMYKSLETCKADFDKSHAVIRSILGIEPSGFIRFPGGSDNKVSKSDVMSCIRNDFISNGINYVDWNVSSGDAEAVKVPAEVIKNNVIKQMAHKNLGVILMHDAGAKTTTVDALPSILNYLKEQGYTFRTFNDITSSELNQMVENRIVNRGAAEK